MSAITQSQYLPMARVREELKAIGIDVHNATLYRHFTVGVLGPDGKRRRPLHVKVGKRIFAKMEEVLSFYRDQAQGVTGEGEQGAAVAKAHEAAERELQEAGI